MEEIVNLIGSDASALDVSDKIKDILFAKSAEKIENMRPTIGASMFDEPEEGGRGIRRMIIKVLAAEGTLNAASIVDTATVVRPNGHTAALVITRKLL